MNNQYLSDKYLKKHDEGLVDWSKEGMQMLNSLPEIVENGGDLGARGILGGLLVSRGFKQVELNEVYDLSDSDRLVSVLMDSGALRVVRNGIMYNFPMHYDRGQEELCDLWEMIRKAWVA